MLKSYEAIDHNGELKWLAEEPPIHSAHIIVTILRKIHPVSNVALLILQLLGKEKRWGSG